MDWTGKVAEIDAAVVAAIDAFVGNAHFYDETAAHGDALWEVVTLMDSSEQQARYLSAAKNWLQRWAPRHLAMDLHGPLNRFFVMLFRGHYQPEFPAATADDAELIETLRDFALAEWMLGTDAAFLAENAGRELARFGRYHDAGIYPIVSAGVRTVLERYDPYGRGRFVWVATATTVTYHDDCGSYGICGFREELEVAILPIEHTCGGTARVRAQNLEAADLSSVCGLLDAVETRFHRQLRTGGEPVADDFNSAVEVVVFAAHAEYAAYSSAFFGNNTNNGGIYLEGDPDSHPPSIWQRNPRQDVAHVFANRLVHTSDGQRSRAGGRQRHA